MTDTKASRAGATSSSRSAASGGTSLRPTGARGAKLSLVLPASLRAEPTSQPANRREDQHIDVRIERDAERLHALGPRAIAEFLREIMRDHDIKDATMARLERWRYLSPAMVRDVLDAWCGGRSFQRVLREVPHG